MAWVAGGANVPRSRVQGVRMCTCSAGVTVCRAVGAEATLEIRGGVASATQRDGSVRLVVPK